MVDSRMRNELITQIDQLPSTEQQRVLDFVRSLASPKPDGLSGKEMLRFWGILDSEDARMMQEAIEEACERIDDNGW